MINYSRNELMNNFPSITISRGINYANANRVILTQIKSNEIFLIEAKVQGSHPMPYKVSVKMGKVEKYIDGICSCHIGYNCKHVVAVIVVAQKHLEKINPDKFEFDENPNYDLSAWMNKLDEAVNAKSLKIENEVLVFILNQISDCLGNSLCVSTYLARSLKKGGLGNPKKFHPSTEIKRNKITTDDLKIFSLLNVFGKQNRIMENEYILGGKGGLEVIKQLLKTGRCYWEHINPSALTEGPVIKAKVIWEMHEDGTQKLVFKLPTSSSLLLPVEPLCYVNPNENTLGEVQVGLPDKIVISLLHIPPVPPTQANKFISKLQENIGRSGINIPLPKMFQEIKSQNTKPQPHLYIHTESINFLDTKKNYYAYMPISRRVILAELFFYYDGIKVGVNDSKEKLTRVKESTLIQHTRDKETERQYIVELSQAHQLVPLMAIEGISNPIAYHNQCKNAYFIAFEEDIQKILYFKETSVKNLVSSGWHIDYAENDVNNFIEIESWYTELSQKSEYDWFGLELGIIVNGKRVNLLPHLIEALKNSRLSNTVDHKVILKLPDIGLLPIPAERINNIMNIITQLIDPERMSHGQEIKISHYHASLLIEMEKAFASSELRWFGNQKLREVGEKLSNFKKLNPVAPPKGFLATLRPYQQDGINWLQFLCEFRFNGILADDMGLGKTVQTLAHLSVQKQKKRLNKPCLIIAPTSVIQNWNHEIKRFSPYLKTLLLQGADRKIKFDKIESHDIVLTTYPLILHDKEILLAQQYHMIILDEAQYIKNAQAKLTQIIQQFKAEHRLCLTGTPLENHLGELWSLFHFLMPGLLGTSRAFKTRYRTPIEKNHDKDSQKGLSTLIKPFILRRTKQEVVEDLPQKTEVIQTIEMRKEQRDLYEGIRLAMHKKIKKIIDQKGVERSQIFILDALLKLRQVCCDPRLLKIDAAKKINESAKLEALMEMLEQMFVEKRRILLFSQFTSMLSLIEKELQLKKIAYVKLIGSTKDRITPIQEFQSGNVPLFLISLKAGGTGLNLTAADTVIHYDPWWNPAVEQQATDRAHRIGQKKAVFVYKLVTASTVEEKILEMQKKKKSLVDSIFKGENYTGKITKQDFNMLFGA